ncbi:hypothetical protein DIU31_030465 [Mucilaginibacter rubeus]|uniref:Uncharacterized protein n=1 Tax=Mucilaginibacter rubeus TaxID=2027860 RepID=A0AAE6JKD9_9SPHI|nr:MULTISPECIES: hypothetical protein [Mucilaginibacter]QEM07614.1 hypothetical protein DIU31_030465 [Mucilaginibacter rubeus]QEM20068.1 hypothetical protein DIU38_030065 [Mucilaginibacter gossypii]QTE43221.1 hypothetical protein J3L19_30600 [Mucilaginibacter rubeus]QTE49821.1 hypothetical protein J3L21_30555 [Mucilaginibacter rubeus]QTE54913.1 hypothetical protein J3L23_22180 [Mucilaginibacter rubeus]
MIPYSQAVEQLEEEKPKIYTLNSIRVATFIFGPLAAGYLVSQNYKAFNEKDKSTTTWIIAVVALIAIIGLAVITSNTERFPRFIFPLAYAWGTFLLVQKFQGEQMKEHFATGGEIFTIWRALLAGLICLIVTLAAIFLILLMIPGALEE